MNLDSIREGETVPDTDLNLFSKLLERHDSEITDHETRLEEHEMQLRVQAEQIKQLHDNAIKLENVVMSESRETRLTITQTNKDLHELIKGLMGFKTGQNQLTNSLKMARWESIAKIVGILAGSGGVLYYVLSNL